MKYFLAIFLIIQSYLHAGDQSSLPFSGGKFGKTQVIRTTDVIENTSNNLRSSCYDCVHINGNLNAKWNNYLMYSKVEVSAETKATYGTCSGSCNIPWDAPIIAARIAISNDDIYNPPAYHAGIIKDVTKYNESYVKAKIYEERYGLGVSYAFRHSWGEHVAGSMLVRTYVKID